MSRGKRRAPAPIVAMYEVPDDQVAAGSTFGNATSCSVIKASGALDSMYSVDIGAHVIGSLSVHRWDGRSGVRLVQSTGTFEFHPEQQVHRFELSNHVAVRETIFVPNRAHAGSGPEDPPAVYYLVEMTNPLAQAVDVETYAFCQMRGDTAHDVSARFDARRRGIVWWNRSRRTHLRLFACSERPASHSVTGDHGLALADECPGDLRSTVDASALDPLGALHVRSHIAAHQRAEFWFLVVFTSRGPAGLRKVLAACPPARKALAATREHFAEVLRRATVVTPSPEVNRGVLWAKANMLRVQSKTRTGWAFTNDPGHSNNAVARDAAWYAYGCDFVMPDFSRALLQGFVKRQMENGKIIEYYDMRNGKTEDYGLNINDDTPLLVLALWHHYQATGDRAFLRSVFPSAVKAARYILSQRDKRGLVWCTATGTGTRGIAGWRNIIDGYRLSGATTEVNSECYAALRTVSSMARILRHHDEAEAFFSAAETLKSAINAHLFNSRNGLYYLNIDVNGVPNTEVTADLVFPVIFGVASHDTASRIVSRLAGNEFVTDAGIRTVPRTSPAYEPGPRPGYGLLGGVWEAMSFWYAFAAAPFMPHVMATALEASFAHYASNPRRNNTVPGQFSEWLHGETLVNCGMMLSPWFPPRYLWAAVEGAGGLDLAEGPAHVSPRLPADWNWLAVRNVVFRRRRISWLAVKTPKPFIYADFHLAPDTVPHELFEEEVSDEMVSGTSDIAHVGFRRGRSFVLFSGNTSNRTTVTSLRFNRRIAGEYRMRIYKSLYGEWKDEGRVDTDALRDGVAVRLESKGFQIVDIRQET